MKKQLIDIQLDFSKSGVGLLGNIFSNFRFFFKFFLLTYYLSLKIFYLIKKLMYLIFLNTKKNILVFLFFNI